MAVALKGGKKEYGVVLISRTLSFTIRFCKLLKERFCIRVPISHFVNIRLYQWLYCFNISDVNTAVQYCGSSKCCYDATYKLLQA
jgi:hypothetical protein